MLIIHKYLTKTVISTIFLVVLLLLGLEIFIEFTREFPDVGTGDYGLLQVFAYVPMMLPLDVYQLFPMAGLLGSMMGLGILASHSELVVMRASGMSIFDITKAVLKAAALLAIVMFIVGEVFAPLLQHKANIYKTEALGSGQTLVTRHGGIWVRTGNNFVHIDKVLSRGQIEGITRYTFNDENRLQLSSFANSGQYENKKWIFYNVQQTNFQDNGTTNQNFAKQQWDMNLSPKLLGIADIDTDQKSLPELYTYIQYLKQSGLNYNNYQFTLWQRIFQPLATLVMILLAVPFVFGPLRTVTMGLRILTGIVMGFGFYILNQFVGPMSMVYQIPPFIAAILPTVVFSLLGAFMINKVRV